MSKQVMVVDDDPAVVRLCQLVLERDGYRVSGALNAAQCLDSLNENPVDLILLDTLLEDMSGWELLDKIKSDARLGSIPVILVTGVPHADSQAKPLLAGYIRKPFHVTKLLDEVRNVLGDNGHRGQS